MAQGRSCGVCDGAGRIAMTRCAVCCMTKQVERAIQAYRWSEKGHLPAPGAVLEQAHTWLEANAIIDRLWAHHREQRIEREHRRIKRR